MDGVADVGQDLTGMRSGKLTVLEKTDEKRKGSTLWRCRCDCGREILLEPFKIKRQLTQSCGCSRKGHGIKDLTGQRFGRLVAEERLEEKTGSSYLWRCRCDCGQETKVPAKALLSGNTTSCGCARADALRERAEDITGKRFGYLTAVEPAGSRYHGSVMWKCRCDCGSECCVSYNSLVSGNTASCGCKKKEHEQPPLHYVDGTCIEMIDHPILRSNNTSGFTGVVATGDGRWRAQIIFQGKLHVLGTYRDIQMAAEARRKGEEKYFGEFLDEYYAAQAPEMTRLSG